MKRILIIGSNGQVGTELSEALREKHGAENVITSDIKEPQQKGEGPFEILDVLDKDAIERLIDKYEVKEIYLLAALLSATAEKNPEFGWELNMQGLFNVLDLVRDKKLGPVFWPSSIAVFGPNTPREKTPQYTVMDPATVYGISKLSGELWCDYYFRRYGVDVRSIRYPGLISYKAEPGGGTTDYAVDIFYEAIRKNSYTSFLKQETNLPMLYMEDAVKATINIMEAPAEKVKIRTSYNLTGFSFNPQQLAQEIQKHRPDFSINYEPDYRQKIADSWPGSIDDTRAREDWGWSNDYSFEQMVADMLTNIEKKLAK